MIKKLSKYIKENNYNFDSFDNFILSECNIELWKNTPILMFGNNINESLGIFNGAKDIANYILEKLKKDKNIDSLNIVLNDIKNYNGNQFTDVIIIYPKYNKSYKNSEEAGYILSYMTDEKNANDYNVMRWNESDEKFSFIEIIIKCDFEYLNQIYSLLLHELNHAYNDYIHIKKSGFESSLIKRDIKSNYNIIGTKNEDDSLVEKVCKDLLYMLNKSEQEAYIAQLNGELKDKYKNIKDAIKDLTKSNVYQNYKTIYINYNRIFKSKKYTEEFCNVYRKLNNNDNISNDKIIKTIQNTYEKFWKKFINHIYHIATDHIVNEAYITKDSNENIKVFEKYDNNNN